MSSPLRYAALWCLPILSACGADDRGADDPSLIHTVGRGDLVVTVRERGEVQAAKDTRVSSQLEGRATLIYLIREGTVVKAGEKLAELDASGIQEKRAGQAITVAKADATVQQARKNFEIMEKELHAAEKTAESRLKIALLRKEKFIGQPRTLAYGVEAAVADEPGANGSDPDATESDSTGSAATDPAATSSDATDSAVTSPAGTGALGADPTSAAAAGTNAEMVGKLQELLNSEKLNDPHAGTKYGELIARVLDLLGAEVDLERAMGEMANQILQQIDEISLARADLELAADTLNHSQRLADRNFITKNELERDRITHKRQLSRVTVAWNNQELLIKYTLPETLIGLEQEVENAELGLESVRASNEGRRVQQKAELDSAEAEFQLARDLLANYDEQIEKAVLTAPTPGLVVYGRFDWDEPVYEGMEVRERQEVIILPDVSSMVAALKVHEAQIDKVATGQPASVKVDAFPDRTFAGRVSYVSTLPEPSRNPDLKMFKVTVLLDFDNSGGTLRPGMNATVVVDVGVIEGVLSVPLPAIKRHRDTHYVWKATPHGPVATEVQLGGNNLTHVEIVAGLVQGDRIHVVEPPGAQLPAEMRDAGRGAPAVEEAAGDGGGATGSGTGGSR